MKSLPIHLLLLLLSFNLYSQNQNTPPVRSMYVNGFFSILGNAVKEDSLLRYAVDSGFNYLALYELHRLSLSSSPTNVAKLSAFMHKARVSYGIQNIGAVGESYNSFANHIVPYNSSRTNASEKFNVFNVEFEFWSNASTGPGGYYCTQYLQPSGCSCDTAGAFRFYMNLIRKVDSLAASQGIISEIYVGWFNQGQAQQMQRTVDRILLHSYRINETTLYSYAKTRLQYLASNNTPANVIALFSAEPTFMGPWLQSHSQIEAFQKYAADMNNDPNTWKQYINLQGFTWFAYGFLPKPAAGTFAASITASGNTNICRGDSVLLTAGTGSSYLWSNGETTSSIKVRTSGNYYCIVTASGITDTSNVINVIVNDVPQIGMQQNAVPGSVTLTATPETFNGTISSYAWFMNGNAIAGANSASYNATTSGDYFVMITTGAGCTTASAVQAIIVPAVVISPTMSCSVIVPSGLSAVPQDATSELLRWNAFPVCDSLCIRYNEERNNNSILVFIPYQPTHSYLLSNLTPNKKYTWRIRTYCGGVASNFSQKNTFTTIGTGAKYTLNGETIYEDETNRSVMLNTYPNPIHSALNLKITSDVEIQSEIRMIDIAGKTCLITEVNLMTGTNNLEFDTSSLPGGLYFIVVSNEKWRMTNRIIKTD